MEWIDVRDRRPDHGNPVLVRTTEPGFEIDWLDCGYFYHDVTHWMPLPEPPKTDQEMAR